MINVHFFPVLNPWLGHNTNVVGAIIWIRKANQTNKLIFAYGCCAPKNHFNKSAMHIKHGTRRELNKDFWPLDTAYKILSWLFAPSSAPLSSGGGGERASPSSRFPFLLQLLLSLNSRSKYEDKNGAEKKGGPRPCGP